MDRVSFIQKFKDKLKAMPKGKLIGGGVALVLLFGGGGFYMTRKPSHPAPAHPKAEEHAAVEDKDAHSKDDSDSDSKDSHSKDSDSKDSHDTKVKVTEHTEHKKADVHATTTVPADGIGHSIVDRYKKAWKGLITKAEDLQVAHEENYRLRLENVNLRRWGESLRFDCSALDAQNHSNDSSLRLEQETGARVGRVLASIAYRPPANLLPHQLFTLAVSYFKAEEFEKAAVILTFLTGLEDNASYKVPRNFLMTGVAWYRLDHFKLADAYFDKVLDSPDAPELQQYQAQARLWKAVAMKRMNQHEESQKWLYELLDHHPRSTEAMWINSSRTPAEESHGPDAH